MELVSEMVGHIVIGMLLYLAASFLFNRRKKGADE